MSKKIKVALIGLDTSHTIEFARRMVAPDCSPESEIANLRPISCLRFTTPFLSEDGLNGRQQTLESLGITVTTDFDDAVKGSDALMLLINDPALHLEYLMRCADLRKPVFIDKPLADNLGNGRKICEVAKAKGLQVFSASSLRDVPQLAAACNSVPKPLFMHAFGPLSEAPAGSNIVWYGVHAVEMLERGMGRGATSVSAKKDGAGITAIVEYPGNRRGVVELNNGVYVYGGCLRDQARAIPFVADVGQSFSTLLEQVARFFRTGRSPLELEETLEVMALLDAIQRSLEAGEVALLEGACAKTG
jgi:predicted dehydrogenase